MSLRHRSVYEWVLILNELRCGKLSVMYLRDNRVFTYFFDCFQLFTLLTINYFIPRWKLEVILLRLGAAINLLSCMLSSYNYKYIFISFISISFAFVYFVICYFIYQILILIPLSSVKVSNRIMYSSIWLCQHPGFYNDQQKILQSRK